MCLWKEGQGPSFRENAGKGAAWMAHTEYLAKWFSLANAWVYFIYIYMCNKSNNPGCIDDYIHINLTLSNTGGNQGTYAALHKTLTIGSIASKKALMFWKRDCSLKWFNT